MYATPAFLISHRPSGDVLPGERDGTSGRRPQTDQRFRELALPVPLDPRDPEDLAGSDLEADPVQLPLRQQTVDLEDRLCGLVQGFLEPEQHRRPTIISASFALVVSAGRVAPTTRPRRNTVMRSAISRTSSSL